MEGCSLDFNNLPSYSVSTHSTALHILLVILFTEDLIIERVVGSFDHLPTLTAALLGLLKIFVTDGFVLEEMVGSPQLHVAYMTLHAVWMVVRLVVDHAVADDLQLTDTALLSARLKTFSTVRVVVFSVELPIHLLGAALTPEALLVVHLPEGRAPVLRQRPQAAVTIPCLFINCLNCSVSYFSLDLWIIEIYIPG